LNIDSSNSPTQLTYKDMKKVGLSLWS